MHHLLLCPPSLCPNGEQIDLAIQAVGESKSEELIQQLTHHLMGDEDDTPKVGITCTGSLQMYVSCIVLSCKHSLRATFKTVFVHV